MTSNPEIIILGGGLSGLLTAYELQKEGLSARILEARERPGGRILTLRPEGVPPLEMGATWLGRKHRHLVDLLGELGIGLEEQYMGSKGYYEPMSISPPQLVDLPRNEEPSYRIEGGSDRLIRALSEYLDPAQILLEQAVAAIWDSGQKLRVQTQSHQFEAALVISTLPPRLLVERIEIMPAWPGELVDIATRTHTWMAEAIKVALTFEYPFWREPGTSGTIFSNVGPVDELYDHSGEGGYALKGFMNPAYHALGREERKTRVLKQLCRFYENHVNQYKAYHEKVWQSDPYTFAAYDGHVIPHQHNGHPVFQQTWLGDRLLISGSETASEFPGYMEGAVESARRSVRQVKALF